MRKFRPWWAIFGLNFGVRVKAVAHNYRRATKKIENGELRFSKPSLALQS